MVETIGFPVTANQSSAGDYLPIDSDTLAGCTVTNSSAYAVEYSTDGVWTTIAAGGSATINTGAIATTSLRFRKKTGDSIPVVLSVAVTHPGVTQAQLATDAAGNPQGIVDSRGNVAIQIPTNVQRYASKFDRNASFNGATVATQTLCSAAVGSLPGSTDLSGLLVTPQTATAAGILARADFAAPLDWSNVACVHVPIIPSLTSSAGITFIYLTFYFDATTSHRMTYKVSLQSLVPGQVNVIPIMLNPVSAAAAAGVSTASAAAVSAGGSGYVVGDLLRVSGGTGTATTLMVTAASTGVVTSASVVSAGAYTAAPGNPASTVALSGVGTGATFNLTTAVTSVTPATDGTFSKGGTLNWANVYGIGIQNGNNTTAKSDNYFWIGDILPDYKSTPAAMIGFDGGYVSQWTHVLPLLQKYNIPATFYIQKYRLGTAGYMTLAQVKALSDAGHRIALHSYSKDLNTNDSVTFPDAASITAEVTGFMQWAAANSLNYIPDHAAIAIASPFETPSDVAFTQRAWNGYYNGGIRTVRHGNDAYNPSRTYSRSLVKGPNLLTRIIKSTTTLNDLIYMLDAAEMCGTVASVYGHTCVTSGPASNDCTVALLDAYLAEVAKRRGHGRLVTITPDQM